jgi:hypothetical protein
MLTDDPLLALHARRRRAVPADPSEDELARHWSLTPADRRAQVRLGCRRRIDRRVSLKPE